jgi:hypothetical protein
MTIFRDLASRPLIVIRFNPDGYKKKKCFDFNDKNQIIVNESEWEMRSNALKEEINFHLTHIPEKEITMKFLFYRSKKIRDMVENKSEENEEKEEENKEESEEESEEEYRNENESEDIKNIIIVPKPILKLLPNIQPNTISKPILNILPNLVSEPNILPLLQQTPILELLPTISTTQRKPILKLIP